MSEGRGEAPQTGSRSKSGELVDEVISTWRYDGSVLVRRKLVGAVVDKSSAQNQRQVQEFSQSRACGLARGQRRLSGGHRGSRKSEEAGEMNSACQAEAKGVVAATWIDAPSFLPRSFRPRLLGAQLFLDLLL